MCHQNTFNTAEYGCLQTGHNLLLAASTSSAQGPQQHRCTESLCRKPLVARSLRQMTQTSASLMSSSPERACTPSADRCVSASRADLADGLAAAGSDAVRPDGCSVSERALGNRSSVFCDEGTALTLPVPAKYAACHRRGNMHMRCVECHCLVPATQGAQCMRIPEDCFLRCDKSAGRRGDGGGDSADSLKWRAASASKLDWSLAANCSSLSPAKTDTLSC